MPICTTCSQSIAYLYTVYESEYNLRLEKCSQCRAFVDPYVEHDTLTLVLDLILLKRGVYRHLLYNRGTDPRRLVGKSASNTSNIQKSNIEPLFMIFGKRWLLTCHLGGALIFLDACMSPFISSYWLAVLIPMITVIRWSYLHPNQPKDVSPWTEETIKDFFRVLLGTFAETFAFQSGIIFACYITLKLVDWLKSFWYSKSRCQVSDIRREFRLSLIPLSLFYSSLIKLFLLFLLTIWVPKSTPSPHPGRELPEWTRILGNNTTHMKGALELLYDDRIDREWIVRNVLGGMSAGFGLRIILDIYPSFTTMIILAGWASKTLVARLVSDWVGGNEGTGEAWLAYSIP
ncbi:Arv1-like family-domain-containing protein [Crucibulum laeve]|uniref:Protein ARV n=1 Tax=Crucibulum laeve TaxID=68775 RepID=A0A5C3LXG9_9AGAR|nr:Arv1-like family-domain-containing protein [Crucibulum laeve]